MDIGFFFLVWIFNPLSRLTLIWAGFLGVRFEVCVCVCGGGGGEMTPCQKLVRIMLETSNLARMYTPICSFRKDTFYYLGPLNFADVSIFVQKLAFFLQKSAFTQSNIMRAVLENF